MPALLLSILLSPAPAAAQLPPRPCKPQMRWATQRGPMTVRPLSEAPPAKLVLGVYREVNGCTEPVVLRERVGTDRR